MITRTSFQTLVLALGTTFFSGPFAAGQALYNVVAIPPPPGSGGQISGAGGINDHGQVVGLYTVPFPDGSQIIRSFVFQDSTGPLDAFPQARTSVAEGINNQGQIALYGGDSHRTSQAYRHTPGVGYEPLGSFGGTLSEVSAINASGQVTGFSETADGQEIAFRYTDGVGMESLGTLTGGSSNGIDINNQGWVVGASAGHAFLFRDGPGIIDLGVGAAYGINNNGFVVGRLSLDGVTLDSFIYHDGTMQVLTGTPFGSGLLGDINDQNVAVGTGLANGDQRHALLWTEAGGLTDLNSLLPEDSGWTLLAASGINELGQISGQGFFNGTPSAFRLDPVPEPTTWALLGLGGLVWLGWRRKHHR